MCSFYTRLFINMFCVLSQRERERERERDVVKSFNRSEVVAATFEV
jgi:hypothetical protein